MKIVIDARLYGQENGGIGRYIMSYLSELAKQDKKNEYHLLLRAEYMGKLNLGENFHEVLVDDRHYSVAEQFSVIKAVSRIKPDVTHFLHFNVPLRFTTPFVVTIHDLLMHQGVGRQATTLPFWKYHIKRLAYRKIFDHAVHAAKEIIVPSEFVKTDLLRTYKVSDKKVHVIYEGVTAPSKRGKSSKAPSPYFLYVGNAYPHKNIGNLIKAVKKVNEKTKINLVLVNPRDVFTTRLKALIKAENAEHIVTIKHAVNDNELFALYESATAFVYPSLSEGFGLPGIEAFLAGTPVLASDIPIFHEVYQDHAQYFDPHNVESISDVMTTFLASTPNVSKIKKAQQFVSKYSWSEMAKRTRALYKHF